MPRNNYTTQGKATNLLRHFLQFQNLQWAQRAHRPLCSGSCRTFCGVLSHSCQSWYRWLQPPSATVWLAKLACSAGHTATQLSQGTHSYISTKTYNGTALSRQQYARARGVRRPGASVQTSYTLT